MTAVSKAKLQSDCVLCDAALGGLAGRPAFYVMPARLVFTAGASSALQALAPYDSCKLDLLIHAMTWMRGWWVRGLEHMADFSRERG